MRCSRSSRLSLMLATRLRRTTQTSAIVLNAQLGLTRPYELRQPRSGPTDSLIHASRGRGGVRRARPSAGQSARAPFGSHGPPTRCSATGTRPEGRRRSRDPGTTRRTSCRRQPPPRERLRGGQSSRAGSGPEIGWRTTDTTGAVGPRPRAGVVVVLEAEPRCSHD